MGGGWGAPVIIGEFKAKGFGTVSESGPDTPKSPKRIINDKEETYRQINERVLNLPPLDLVVKRIGPLIKSQRQPDNKFRILCNDIQNIEWNGDRILPTLGTEIVKLQNATVDGANGGLKKVSECDWPNDLGSLLYDPLKYFWFSTHRNYLESVKKRTLKGRQSIVRKAIAGGIRKSLVRFGIFRA